MRKGDWSDEEYRTVLNLLSQPELQAILAELLKRLDAAGAGSRPRFFRDQKAQGETKQPRPTRNVVPQRQMDYEAF